MPRWLQDHPDLEKKLVYIIFFFFKFMIILPLKKKFGTTLIFSWPNINKLWKEFGNKLSCKLRQ